MKFDKEKTRRETFRATAYAEMEKTFEEAKSIEDATERFIRLRKLEADLLVTPVLAQAVHKMEISTQTGSRLLQFSFLQMGGLAAATVLTGQFWILASFPLLGASAIYTEMSKKKEFGVIESESVEFNQKIENLRLQVRQAADETLEQNIAAIAASDNVKSIIKNFPDVSAHFAKALARQSADDKKKLPAAPKPGGPFRL